MASIIQKKRLVNEVKLLNQQPLHYCTAYPDESNPLIWYFLIIGQKETDYHKGEYIGKIVHSPKYPAEPPDYFMLTPSGRYNIGSKICLTNSSYHKGDWSSTWNILSILIAFYSIWLDDKEHGISHITDSPVNRKRMAVESVEYNNKNNPEIYAKFDRTNLNDETPATLMKKKEEPTKKQDLEQIIEQIVKPEPVPVPVPVPDPDKKQDVEHDDVPDVKPEIVPLVQVILMEQLEPLKKIKKATKNKIIINVEEKINQLPKKNAKNKVVMNNKL